MVAGLPYKADQPACQVQKEEEDQADGKIYCSYTGIAQQKVPVPRDDQQGSHGLGLAPGNPVYSTWKDRLKDWLTINHWAN